MIITLILIIALIALFVGGLIHGPKSEEELWPKPTPEIEPEQEWINCAFCDYSYTDSGERARKIFKPPPLAPLGKCPECREMAAANAFGELKYTRHSTGQSEVVK